MNYDLKEKIRDYWSQRAATFDDSFSHSIADGVELQAWKHSYSSLIARDRLNVLELGSGTGEITRVLRELGHSVTGLDFSEAMLDRAKAKHADYQSQIKYFLADAENTKQPDAAFDLVTCRHLMWTLLDPAAALTDWHRVTKPGGDLVIFDGNFIAIRRRDHVLREILAVLERIRPSGEVHSAELQAAKTDIDSQLYFADGLSFDILAGLVAVAGYTNITKHSYTPIRRAQRKVAGPRDWLRTFLTDRFILHAQKPPQAQ